MPETLYRLAYYSLNALPVETDLVSEVQQILRVSRENNARAKVTGALLFNRGCFAQILEGAYSEVERTFETLQSDERHTGIVPLQFEEVSERGFGPWSMAYVGTAAEDAGRYDGVGVASDFDPKTCTAAGLFQSLHRVMLTQEPVQR
jgi:hypothetical protein